MNFRNKLKYIALTSLSIFSLGGVVFGTFAWFQTANAIDSKHDISGESLEAYFAYGNGTAERPYGIATARHLYNLAWLQYMGQFNTGESKRQYYFELADSIPSTGLDMTGYIIPPIGTEQNPFVGNFNGNGKIIKNLTISNDESELFKKTNPHPDSSQVDYTTPKIVGFFGVVGNLDTAYTGTYSSSVNTVYNLGLVDPKIQSQAQNTLVGILAGYVDAEIENVAIENPTINVLNSSATYINKNKFTDKISDYYVIGYCKDTEQKRYTKEVNKINDKLYKVDVTDSEPFSITEQGSTTGWGGSVDMKSMYDYLDADWNTLNHPYSDSKTINSISYPTTRTIDYDMEGRLISQVDGGDTVSGDIPYNDNGLITGSGSYTHKYYNIKKNKNLTNPDTEVSNSYETSSISYVVQTSYNQSAYSSAAEYGEFEEQFMCLTGRKDVSMTGKTLSITTNSYRDESAKYIYFNDGNVTHYLSLFNNEIDNSSTSQTTGWALISNRLATHSSTGTTLYLSCNNSGVLSLTNNSQNATTWSYSDTYNNFLTTSGTLFALSYSDGAWKGIAPTYSTYHVRDNNNHYLLHGSGSHSDVSVGNGDGNTTDYDWYLTDNNYLSTTSNGDVYLKILDTATTTSGCGGGTTHKYSFHATNRSSDPSGDNVTYTYTTMTKNNNTLRASVSEGTRYLRYNNGWNETSTSTNLNFEPQYNNLPSVSYDGSTVVKIPTSEQTTTTPTLSIPHTYFPLRYDENMAPDSLNTGYVVSGGNYVEDPYGDIRVSSYELSRLHDIGNVQHDDEVDKNYRAINTVYTKTFDEDGNYSNTDVDANEFYADSDKYASSKKNMQYVLAENEDDRIYGLHFMNATISMSNPAVAEGAVVNGSNYYNLELPTDCVDFNLKEKGKINFFAGSYYRYNNSFFSLYEIVRKKPTSKSTDGTITLTYDGLDTNLKMKFSYDHDPFAVAGHTFDHITINDNLLNGEGLPYDITNTPLSNYFTLAKSSKKYEHFNLKFYDNVSNQPYLEFEVSTLANELKEIRKIKKVYADPTDTDDNQSYCYQYEMSNGDTKYSEPYYYSMGKKLKVSDQTLYEEGAVRNDLPSAYDELVFNTACIEVGTNQNASLAKTGSGDDTTGYVYYYEIPMNEGEFALGSVRGCNGAYLMYLDIAANASLIKRTTITEHYIFTEEKYIYPAGVAIVVDAASALASANAQTPVLINPTKGVTAFLDSQFRGNISIDLAVTDTVKTATLTRTNLPNAPNDYVAGNHAFVCYKSDEIASVVRGTDAQGATDQGSLEELPNKTINTEIKRVNYYDFSAADGLTWTMIEEINGDINSRTVVQQINGTTISQANIKIYNENGQRVAANNIDFTGLVFNTGDSNIVLQFKYTSTEGSNVTLSIKLDNTDPDAQNCYDYAGYTIIITNTGYQITVKVLAVTVGEDEEITINGQDAVVNLEITIPTPQNP